MAPRDNLPLGYRTATNVLELGRAAFFGSVDADLPKGRSAERVRDDRTPSFGFVGNDYERTRVLLLGINPGNGPNAARPPADERMMPALIDFAENPTPMTFRKAQLAYKEACESWPIWKRHCSEIVGAGRLTLNQISYSNCLPYRTESRSDFSDDVAERAANLYASPLIEELRPKVVVALGKRAAEILSFCTTPLPTMIVWNRAQAATSRVLDERSRAAEKLFAMVNSHRQ